MLFCCRVFSQDSSYYISPLPLPLHLSGTFGEPREDHFHSGIDIRTNEVTGYPVFAVANGELARIKVSPYGYGKAVYIRHPNGYTSVYAHLERFSPELEKIVYAEQVKKKSYEVDILAPPRVSFKQGDTIAYSGNTGGSQGPHLHFELRETASEKPVNPLLHGYKIEDNLCPLMTGLYWYDLDRYYELGAQEIKVKAIDECHFVADTLFVPSNTRIGLGWKGYDRQDSVPNKNGLYRLSLLINTLKTYFIEMNSFSFDETRYVNSTVDYKVKKLGNGDIYQCFKLPGNKSGISEGSLTNGYLAQVYGDTLKVEIIAEDKNNNKSRVAVPIVRTAAIDTVLWSNQMLMYNGGTAKLQLSENAFYDSIQLNISVDNVYDCCSEILHFHDDIVPLHKPAEIKLLAKNLIQSLYPKAVIIHKSFTGKETALTTKNEGPWFSASNRETGQYYLKIDTIKPTIESINYNLFFQTIVDDTIKFIIKDDLSGIEKYDAYLNGKWIPMEYDAKNHLLFWTVETASSSKNQTLKLFVSDAVGNTNTTTVTIKPPSIIYKPPKQ